MQGDRLKGKVAIVTGAARGIGFGIAQKYAQEGAQVVIADVLLEEGQEAAKKIGERAFFYHIDMRSRSAIFEMADKIHEKFGHIDVLVNCAGIARPCPTMKLSEEVLDEVIGRTPYGITKGAINLLTQQLGAEWAMYNIKVNAIAPGWIRTEMVERPLRLGILNQDEILSVSPIGRFGKVEEVANLACFLACEESDYIVGQIIFADGGWNTGIMPNALDYIRENDKEEE